MSTTSLDNIRLLRSILNDSLDSLENAYESRSLRFPSLDEPYDKNAEAELLSLHPDLTKTLDLVISSSYQLLCTVRHPFLSLADASTAVSLVRAQNQHLIKFSNQKFNVPEVLREAGPTGLHSSAIAMKIGAEPTKLARILRLLATHHIFRETAPNVFANNRISSYFCTNKNLDEIISLPELKYRDGGAEDEAAAAGYIGTFTDEVFKASSYMLENLENKETGAGFSATGAAFQKAMSTDQVYFAWLENPDNLYRFARYGACIQGTSLWDPPTTILCGYDWESINQGGVVVDVGGGLGAPAMVLARSYPQIKIIIQERENVVAQGREHWQRIYPEAIITGCVSFEVHDFFMPQTILGAAVYLVRTICHDWPDELVIKILGHLRSAAEDSTRLVLADYLMPYACPSQGQLPEIETRSTTPVIPRPLLTNLGKAGCNAYSIDMTMQVLLNGQERTLDHQIELADKAGWQVIGINRIPNSQFGYLVAKPSPGHSAPAM